MEKIIGIGIDEIEINRIMNACNKDTFLAKYYTNQERLLFEKKRKSAATNFAGKEAVSKALGTGFQGIHPIEIEILRNELGAPYVNLFGNAKKTAQMLGVKKIHISLSDTKQNAIAYVIVTG